MKSFPACLALTLIAWTSATAKVELPAIISDHMVLEKSAATNVWGTAAPGEEVSVTLDGQTVKTTTDADGKWSAALNLEKSGPGPFVMEVKGTTTISVSDVVVGEVWLAAGQSNMLKGLAGTVGSEKEITGSENPLLRQFAVIWAASETPLDDVKGKWICASPKSSGDFSGVAYYFGKSLQNTLQVPVGLINSSLGGTTAEPWTSAKAIDSVPDLKAARSRLVEEVTTYPERRKAHIAALTAWLKAKQREDRPFEAASFAAPNLPTEDWVKTTLPAVLDTSGLPSSGAVWVRREINIAADEAGKPLPLTLREMSGYDRVYWNGQLLTETAFESLPTANWSRSGEGYEVPAEEVGAGTNTLAIRIYSPLEPARFFSIPRIGIHLLPDQWLAKAEYEFPILPASDAEANSLRSFPALRSEAGIPGFLFNAMIHPLLPATISGVIWYQGENNSSRAWQYRTSFPLLITDWRTQWKNVDLPFYFCQLPNFRPKINVPGESTWAELRDAQSSALKLPHTGQAVLFDIGEADDIHPANKKDAGERLARIALAKDYGKDIVFSGPVFASATVEGSRIRVKFTETAEGLVAAPVPATQVLKFITNETAPLVRNSPESELEGFVICGADKKWAWAEAKIDGDSVLVWSDQVPAPVAVRYAWADNPNGNLVNSAGLLASPFRTDDFPAFTLESKL